MKDNWLKKLQTVFLLCAVALIGTAFLPEESQANPPTDCGDPSLNCDGGNLMCAFIQHPDGTFERCRQTPDCV